MGSGRVAASAGTTVSPATEFPKHADCSGVGPDEAKRDTAHGYGVGDSIELLVDAYDCRQGEQLQVIGENSSVFKLLGGKMVPKSQELSEWRWVIDDEDDEYVTEVPDPCLSEVTPVARKMQTAIQRRLTNDMEESTGVQPNEEDTWRMVEDVLMQALLKHWGDGSFSPAQRGSTSPKKDLENSLKGALAEELRSARRNVGLTRSETSRFFSGWASTLYEGVHEDKPCVSLGEATMCFRDLMNID